MYGILKYSGLSAKIGFMLGNLLKQDDYDTLMRKKTVQEVTGYLKDRTYYTHMLSEVDEHTIHRGQLEKNLKASLIDDYIKLFQFMHGDVKKFLNFAVLRYEIEDLKILLRVFNTEHNTKVTRDSLLFLQKYGTVDVEALAESENLAAFIQKLKGSVYYDVLLPFITNTQHLNLFMIEMSLDMYFFSLIWKQKERLLKGKDKKIVSYSFGSEIDILNILWVYRCKKFYAIEKEMIYAYVIPYGNKLRKSDIKALVESKGEKEVQQVIGKTPYSSLFKETNSYYYEKRLAYYVHKMHKRFLRNNRFSIATMMAYLHLKEIEIRNIISLVEGIRYGLSYEQIADYVVQ